MYWRLNLYAVLLAMSALISAVVAVYAWHRRPAPGAVPLALLLVGASVWSLGYGIATGFSGLPQRIFWAKVQYLGIATVPLFMLILVLQFTG